MQSLQNLERNLDALLQRYAAMQNEVARLRVALEDQRQEVMRSHSEVMTLKQRNKHLQTALGMLGDGQDRKKARQELDYVISLVDRALETCSR